MHQHPFASKERTKEEERNKGEGSVFLFRRTEIYIKINK
jgi:hypothetical protein